MKKILVLLLASAIGCRASIPAAYSDIVKLYGAPTGPSLRPIGGSKSEAVGTTFSSDGIDIKINPGADRAGVQFIQYSRTSPFNPLEIGDLLKSLSPEEDWVQVDAHNWALPKAGAKAHWDGAGKLNVSAK